MVEARNKLIAQGVPEDNIRLVSNDGIFNPNSTALGQDYSKVRETTVDYANDGVKSGRMPPAAYNAVAQGNPSLRASDGKAWMQPHETLNNTPGFKNSNGKFEAYPDGTVKTPGGKVPMGQVIGKLTGNDSGVFDARKLLSALGIEEGMAAKEVAKRLVGAGAGALGAALIAVDIKLSMDDAKTKADAGNIAGAVK